MTALLRRSGRTVSFSCKKEKVWVKKKKKKLIEFSLDRDRGMSGTTGAEANIREKRRTTGEGTKPQCQPIDLRCSLRGPLLRREKNKLIEEGGGSGKRGREAEERRRRRKR